MRNDTDDSSESDRIHPQNYVFAINDSQKPEVVSAELRAMCGGDIERYVSISNLYNVDYLHSGVVGLVGVPLEVEYDEAEISEPKLVFNYNSDELRGIPEKNLIVLHYNETDCFYDTMSNAEFDTEGCTVSLQLDEPGVYMLADAFQWYGAWGMDVSEYEYEKDPALYVSDWEREHYTGSIMDIADIDWAMENAPYFKVSTPEQLAGAVYWINAVSDGNSGSYAEIYLENDIDLTGLEWVPMGWSNASDYSFSGVFDGQGHTISNMHIDDSDYNQVGFIGYGLSTEVRNVNFTGAEVSGGSCTGIVGGEIYITDLWSNINVSGALNNVSGDDYGAIIGREAATAFKDCTADVTVDGMPFEYFSYRQKIIAETEVVETFNISVDENYIITRDEHDGFQNLGWTIELDGVQLLDRLAENELTLDTHKWVGSAPGTYKIYLTAYINGTYIRVSNIIEYEL